MTNASAAPTARPRTFLPQDFTVTTWEALQPYFEDLKSRTLDSKTALREWLDDLSELEAVVSEDASWRQIRMTLDTANEDYEKAFTYFVSEKEPKMKPY